jgi:translocation and assembly module TamB
MRGKLRHSDIPDRICTRRKDAQICISRNIWTVLLLLALLVGTSSSARASILDRLLSWVSSSVETKGLAIHWGGELTADSVELRDPAGTYATLEGVSIQWSPTKLLRGEIDVSSLIARHARILRLPESSSSGGGSTQKIAVKALRLDRLDLDPAVAGTAAALKIRGSGQRTASDQAEAKLEAESIDGDGTYKLQGAIDPSGMHAQLVVREAKGGMLARIADLPGLGETVIDASVRGPRNDLAVILGIEAGPLRANANGTLDLEANTFALKADATAPAMSPRPDLSWQAVALSADMHGGFTSPDIAASIRIDQLDAAGARVQQVAVAVTGNKGEVQAKAQLDGVVVPGTPPDLLAAAPVLVTADATLNAPDRPVSFAVHHPIIDAAGTLKTGEVQQADLQLSIPHLEPFAAALGTDLQGELRLEAKLARQAATLTGSLDATIGIIGGAAPVPALVGPSARLVLAGSMNGGSVALNHFSFDAQDLFLTANGTVSPQSVDLSWTAALPRIAPIDPRLDGALNAQGRIGGSRNNMTLAADLSGDLRMQGVPSGPLSAHVTAHGLPNAPAGDLTANGDLLGAPLHLTLAGARQNDGAVTVSIQEADWKSASAHGHLTLPSGAKIPIGQLQLEITSLSDFDVLLGQSLSGSATARLDATAAEALLSARLQKVGLKGTASAGDLALAARVTDPTGNPAVDGQLVLTDVSAHGLTGSARIEAKGPASKLAMQMTANLPNLEGAPARLTATATVDAPAKAVTVTVLNADWKQQRLLLLAPVALGFTDGIDIHDLRAGLGSALVQMNGHIGSTLDLMASARGLPLSLAALASPSLAAAHGTISAETKLSGTPAVPAGTLRIEGSDLRIDTAAGRRLPAASMTATAVLQGASARIDGRLSAGSSRLSVSGRAPFTMAAPFDLHASGLIDLALADAMMGPGEELAGRLNVAADLTGTAARPSGTIRAEASGVRILNETGRALPPANIIATARLEGAAARIDTRLTAGNSHLAVTGRAPFSTTLPLDLQANGALDLAVADPILTASGQRVTGTVTLAAAVAGTAAAPRVTGTAQLSNGDVRDYAQGVHLSNIAARLAAAGDTVRIESLSANAGNGTINGTGTIGVLAPGRPVNLVIMARDATPLSGGVVTTTFNANLAIRGEMERQVSLGDSIDVLQATIQIPSKLPVSVATIPVRIAGAPPAPPLKPGLSPEIAMDLTVRAPQQVFVRGRGLNAELGGTIQIQGSNKQMLPRGSFNLIRGSFNLVGNTLTFTSGDINFNGGSITDPALHLVATSYSGGSTATLTVGGTARNPKLTLSSVPEMPQDQILAQLLFHTDAGKLSPFQLAGIAAALAELSGSTSDFPNPLQSVQNALGLDQLGIGSGANGAPTLQAGRYIGRRLYVGASESASGSGGQTTVQYNLTEGLKLNATVGTGETTTAVGATGQSTGASVGMTYQFQY